MIKSTSNSNKKHFYVVLLMLYYVLAPMEDLLTGNIGTVAKYIAIIIVIAGLYSSGWRISLEFNSLTICIVYLMSLSIISCIWATDVSTAMHRNVAYLLLPGFVLFVSQLRFSHREREAIVTAIILGGIIAVAYVVIANQINITGTQRLQLIEGNDQNNFAALLFLPFMFSVSRLMRGRVLSRCIYAAIAVILLYAILLTGSRGCLVAIILAVCSIVFLSSNNKKIKAFVGLLVIAIFAYFIILPLLPEFIINRLFDDASYRNTINAKENRIGFWRLAFTEIIPQRFPIGVGSGCTPLWLGHFFSTNRGMHNTYINMLCEYGIFGLPVFLWMIYKLVNSCYRQKKVFEASILIGICVIIFFLDSYAKKFFWNVIMILCILDCQKETMIDR